MKENLSSLSARDRAHVEGMLAVFGLSAEHHMKGHLHVPSSSSLELHHAAEHGGTHLVLRSNDLDEVKRWIGVPDRIFEQAPCALVAPTAVVDHEKPLCGLDRAQSTALRDAAKHFVFGDSRQVRWYKKALETYFAPFEVKTYIYTTLNVEGELKFTDPAALILANTILFGPNGSIVSTGNLSIQATYIAKQAL